MKIYEIQKLPQLSLCRVDEIVPKRILSDQRQLFQHLKKCDCNLISYYVRDFSVHRPVSVEVLTNR